MKYACHCTIKAFDGVSNIVSRPTKIIEADSEKEALQKVKEHYTDLYQSLGCTIEYITVPLLRQVS